MLLIHQDKVKSFTPYFVHVIVVIAVVVYVITGAFVIQWIESKDIITNSVNSSEKSASSIRSDTRAQILRRSQECVIEKIKKTSQFPNCDPKAIGAYLVDQVATCYDDVLADESEAAELKPKRKTHGFKQQFLQQRVWSYTDAVLFCFTVITTIGYGHVVPVTTSGRIFVIVYCSIGVPLAMLTIADLGKFLAEFLQNLSEKLEHALKKLFKKRKPIESERKPVEKNPCVSLNLDDFNEEELNDEQGLKNRFFLVLAFIVYILVGSAIVSSYENLDYFEATYFNFITLTTIGLGDIVPQNQTYLFITIIYISVGVALSTIGIEIAAEYLKKLHYFGRKIKDASKVSIWFGGQRLTVKQLVENLSDQLNLPENVVQQIDLDDFVDQAIKVEAGELETLRNPHCAGLSRLALKRDSRPEVSSGQKIDSESFLYADSERALQSVNRVY